jgi:peptidoglycan/xylan/chitin deacetylase (PgdA/CDA1 family)
MAAERLFLCYHAVSESWPSELAIRPTRLREQVEALLAEGYEPRTFSDAAAANDGTKLLAVTFDDAFDSVFELALPILRELGVPATVFVPTDFVEEGTPFRLPGHEWVGTEPEPELMCMSWDRIRTLRDEGWEIGSHTCSHPWLTQVPAEQLEQELRRSRELCAERLGEPPTSLAYPYGDHDSRVVAATASAGYSFACTLPHRFEEFGSDPLQIARIDVTRNEPSWAFGVRTLPAMRRVRATGPMAAVGWLDRNRPHRSTFRRGYKRSRRTLEEMRKVLSVCRNGTEVVDAVARGRRCERFLLRSGIDLQLPDRGEEAVPMFLDAFVEDPLERRLSGWPRTAAVDVGAGGDLLWARLATMGFRNVVCTDPDGVAVAEIEENRERNALRGLSIEQREVRTEAELRALLEQAGTERLDFLRVDGDAAGVELLTAPVLSAAEHVLVKLTDDRSPRLNEAVHRLHESGFEIELEADGKAADTIRIWADRR